MLYLLAFVAVAVTGCVNQCDSCMDGSAEGYCIRRKSSGGPQFGCYATSGAMRLCAAGRSLGNRYPDRSMVYPSRSAMMYPSRTTVVYPSRSAPMCRGECQPCQDGPRMTGVCKSNGRGGFNCMSSRGFVDSCASMVPSRGLRVPSRGFAPSRGFSPSRTLTKPSRTSETTCYYVCQECQNGSQKGVCPDGFPSHTCSSDKKEMDKCGASRSIAATSVAAEEDHTQLKGLVIGGVVAFSILATGAVMYKIVARPSKLENNYYL